MVVSHRSKPNFTEYDKLLRRFRYGEALDCVLNVRCAAYKQTRAALGSIVLAFVFIALQINACRASTNR